jgi:hypothetical protein
MALTSTHLVAGRAMRVVCLCWVEGPTWCALCKHLVAWLLWMLTPCRIDNGHAQSFKRLGSGLVLDVQNLNMKNDRSR